jgi:enoyl-[acyl-carrier protein] reductase I
MSEKPLEGKVGLVFGVANQRSIAWGIARAWAEAGARLILNYQGERVKVNVEELAQSLRDDFGADISIAPCDVGSDEEIAGFFDFVRTQTDHVDLMLHSLAYAPKEALEGRFSNTSRDAFWTAQNISAYSLVALTRETAPLMTNGGSIIAMTFLGSQRVVPNYNVMGVAKASLEATVRYLAADLGLRNIRVNAISAGPMMTLSGRGIAQFSVMYKYYQEHAPLGRSCTLDELGATGLFLAQDGAASITGQVMYVDGGYEILGMPDLQSAARLARNAELEKSQGNAENG